MKKLIIGILFLASCTNDKPPTEVQIPKNKKYYRITVVTKDSLKIKSEIKYAN